MAVSTEDATQYSSKILSEKRKAKKPVMEKMRRARINDSLNELKSLVLQSLNKDASRYSKMEKADILEMCVQYLKEIRRQEHSHSDVHTVAEYRAGFNYCAQEVTKNLSTVEAPGSEHLRTNLLNHLANCCQGNSFSSPSAPAAAPVFTAAASEDRTLLPTSGVAVWVYPSPPPSPLSPVYISPPISPVSQASSPTEKCILLNIPRTLNESNRTVQEPTKPSPSQFWRPW